MDDEFDDGDDELIHNEIRQERMRQLMDQNQEGYGEDDDQMQQMLDFEDVKGPLSSWLSREDVIVFIKRKFNTFLRSFKNETGNYVYEDKIHEMCQNNLQSLEIVFTNLSQMNPTLAIWLADEPALMLPILNDVAKELVSEVYPDYQNTAK